MSASCAAWMVSAPASGQGKTSVTAALARRQARLGRRVRVFKTGPDFLDPMLLTRAAGTPVCQLDLWMNGEADVRARLWQASRDADLILVEGVMGLFDGDPSSADLAARLGLPVLAVIDADAMAQTFGALAGGLARHRPDVSVRAVAANGVAGTYHADLLRGSLAADLAWAGYLPRDPAIALPERHLGLVAPEELADVSARLDALADAWQAPDDAWLTAAPVAFAEVAAPSVPRVLDGCRIAVARDAAFCFLYPANLDLLRQAGAELRFFSPLAGDALPACDAVWLPGGYPELHAGALSQRVDLHRALAAHVAAGKPMLAECGGMLFLLDELIDVDGHRARMAGVLPGRARLQSRLVGLGLQGVELPEGHLRGHSFHHARADVDTDPSAWTGNPNRAAGREAVYRMHRLTAGFMHAYFPSNPQTATALFRPGPGGQHDFATPVS